MLWLSHAMLLLACSLVLLCCGRCPEPSPESNIEELGERRGCTEGPGTGSAGAHTGEGGGQRSGDLNVPPWTQQTAQALVLYEATIRFSVSQAPAAWSSAQGETSPVRDAEQVAFILAVRSIHPLGFSRPFYSPKLFLPFLCCCRNLVGDPGAAAQAYQNYQAVEKKDKRRRTAGHTARKSPLMEILITEDDGIRRVRPTLFPLAMTPWHPKNNMTPTTKCCCWLALSKVVRFREGAHYNAEKYTKATAVPNSSIFGWLWFNRFSYLCETKGKANSYHMGKGSQRSQNIQNLHSTEKDLIRERENNRVQPSAARSQPKKDTALFPTEELKHLREAQCLSLCFRLSLGSQHFLPLCFPLQALLQTDFKAARATHQPPEAVPEALWHVPGGTHPSLSGPARRLRQDSCFKGDKVLRRQHNFEQCIIAATATIIIVTGSFRRTPSKNLQIKEQRGDRGAEARGGERDRETEEEKSPPPPRAFKERRKGKVSLGEGKAASLPASPPGAQHNPRSFSVKIINTVLHPHRDPVAWESEARLEVIKGHVSPRGAVLPYLLREQACVLVAVKLPLDAVGSPLGAQSYLFQFARERKITSGAGSCGTALVEIKSQNPNAALAEQQDCASTYVSHSRVENCTFKHRLVSDSLHFFSCKGGKKKKAKHNFPELFLLRTLGSARWISAPRCQTFGLSTCPLVAFLASRVVQRRISIYGDGAFGSSCYAMPTKVQTRGASRIGLSSEGAYDEMGGNGLERGKQLGIAALVGSRPALKPNVKAVR
ncbi:hypothetical protein Anapl_17836 [Anas platyrhynchos]|uniref:Uncharacterized protein n=1 Tax=Anas platyrhynchos TaxID=8839 RepID=R0KXZ0_ANAPL|nr:hypothetical protein Anapl_17836 [Anas platyrhynchos]